MNAEQNAREAMEVWEAAHEIAYSKGMLPNDQAAASVIAAKLAEKDAEIARLTAENQRLRGPVITYQKGFGPGDGEARQALKPESPDHD